MIKDWIAIATLPHVRRRCIKTALIVGTLLMLINYLDRLLAGQVSGLDWLKIILTYFVPYIVCASASVSAIMENRRATK
ncbi:nitrate/nitrite transporter NrtS [Maritalea mediterranea]|uniref:Nitrate/nitrite transporter NrtS n=1 Tax=Maritalea mediterranea TaxID=2909667 RepID=A0ABS9EAD8_9HYPH|nr:nitrate/nitrite transporter NrtS [Maritalea mediterranea]MCF4098864.1 nitrate/nitrite transporter NrtS [Maritalea mediterranea]